MRVDDLNGGDLNEDTEDRDTEDTADNALARQLTPTWPARLRREHHRGLAAAYVYSNSTLTLFYLSANVERFVLAGIVADLPR